MLFSLDGCKNNHNDESVNVNFEKHLLLNEYPESRTEYEFLDSIDELKNQLLRDIQYVDQLNFDECLLKNTRNIFFKN